MPGKVKVKIVAGRNLPVMDRSSDTTDAYVEVKLGNTTYKTDVCRKSLNPQWNSEWYRFEVDDAELQDEPLQLRLMDHDTYSANDAIGKVYLDLNPLLLPAPPLPAKTVRNEGSAVTATSGSVMSGWFPVYDTMHGIRGEVQVIVKVELFSDFNRFRQSSCGVLFFCSSTIPQGFYAQVIHGFVEELVVNDDPEYQWIDKIRTPRASNEARQTLFFKLSGEVQRKIGLKALDLGGNAVIGYHQCFDLEGESGIVARGIGTAVSLVRLHDATSLNTSGPDESLLLSPFRTAPLYAAPSSPRLCVIPPTPTSSVNPLSSLTQKQVKDERLLPLMGPRFPKSRLSKRGKKRSVVLVSSSNNEKPFTHRRQNSAPFDLGHHAPYKRQNSTKSLVTDLSDLRHLLEQEDMRRSPDFSGSSRFMKVIRHFPKKVNALRGRVQSDDSDFDTVSCSSTRSLSLDSKRRAQKQNRNDSVTAALIRSIMMDSGRELADRGGLSRVIEGEETAVSAPATPKLNLFSSTSELELGGAKDLIHQISSDTEEGIAFIESSSSSCGSSTSDDITDSSAVGLKDEDNSFADDFELQEEKSRNESFSVPTAENLMVDAQASPGKVSKGRVTFVMGCNEILSFDERIKSRSLSPKGRKFSKEMFRKEVSLSPILVKHKMCFKADNQSSSQKHLFGFENLDISESISSGLGKEQKKSPLQKSSRPGRKLKKTFASSEMETSESSLHSSSPFDQEFSAATIALKTSSGGVNIEDLPQPFEPANPQTPPNTAASLSLPPSPSPSTLDSLSYRGNIMGGAVAPASLSSTSACFDCTCEVDFHNHYNMKSEDRNQITLVDSMLNTNSLTNSPTVSLPLLDLCKRQSLSTNVVTNIVGNPSSQPNGHELQATVSMDSCSDTSVVKMPLVESVSGNHVCSLTLDIPRVLSPLHKSRSTTSLVCRHEAAAASHFATDGEREGVPSMLHDEERAGATPHGPSAQLPASAHKHSQSPAKLSAAPAIHRRSSDSDLSVTPKGCSRKRNSLTGSGSSCTGPQVRPPAMLLQPPVMNQDNFEMLEYPFLTVSKFPPGFVQSIGGTVSSRSVKLLERITNLEEPETRDTWWKELRMEVRSHARALGCNVVLGYAEHTSICDDVCVLSAAGTAAVISLQYSTSELDASGGGANSSANVTASEKPVLHHQAAVVQPDQGNSEPTVVAPIDQQQPVQGQSQVLLQTQHQPSASGVQTQKQTSVKQTHDRVALTSSLDRTDFEKDRNSAGKLETPCVRKTRHLSEGADSELPPACSICHIPYSEASVPFRVKMIKCAMCRKGKVPDVLLTTMEPPEGIPVTGRGCLLQAYVCRPKRDTKGELNAKEISDGLPFLEYELHRMLLNKLKVKGMNAIFGLKVQVSIGERMLVGLATGTAMFLTPLPSPPVPTITAGNSWSDERRLLEVQKTLAETVKRNREIYQLKPLSEGEVPANGRCNQSDTEDSEDDLPDMDLATGNKDTCVMEVDDNEDVDVISLLMDPHPPEGFFVVNTEVVPGVGDMEVVRNLQMFTQVWRAKVAPSMPPVAFSKHFHRMLQSVYFKLRRMVPCALGQLQFSVELPEPDELQLSLLGMALGLGEPVKKAKRKAVPSSSSKEHLKKDDNDLIFSLEEDVVLEDTTGAAAVAAVAAVAAAASSVSASSTGSKLRPRSPRQPSLQSQRVQNLLKFRHSPPKERYGVDITPLSYVPGGKIERYLGNLNFFFIRESTAIRESGGLSGFVHSFIAEVLAIVRAHVTALGGNAMVAYFISENVLLHNPHKNQGQCLINVGGDVVYVSYFSNDQ